MIDDVRISKGFRGSANLKRAGERIEWTEERQIEWLKCSLDPIYFARTYMKIVHVDRGLVPFDLYDYQERMINSMKDNRNTIITTARQVGKSTVTCAFILWYVLFHKDKTVALLANKGETAREIMGKIHLAYEHLPKWIQQGVVENNKGSLVLENNSRIIASATSGNAIRGFSINLIFIDEAAFIENWEEFFTSVAPTISSGKTTKIVLVSTPNGLNHFHSLWTNAREKRSDYHPIMVTWREVPGRDEDWRKKTLADLNFDLDKFAQENECEFLGSSGTLINGKTLKAMVAQPPIASSGDGFKQYIAPEPGHSYVIIADTSKGKGLDNSAFSIIDVTRMPYKQVAVFYDNVTPYAEYAQTIFIAAKMYNQAVVLVENNNIGEAVANTLYEDLEYEGVLFTENSGSRGKQISTKAFNKTGVEKGINTTKTVKAKGCSLLKLLCEQNQLIINDAASILELSRFSRKGASWEAEQGAHDDLVMGLVLFAWLTDQQFFKELTDINTLEELRNQRREEVENNMMSIGFVIDDGRDQAVMQEAWNQQRSVLVSASDFDKMMVHNIDDAYLQAQFERMLMGR